MTNKSHTPPSRWLIAIMGTLLQVALGTVYAWSFFQDPVMAWGNWNNTQAAWAFSLAIFFLGLSAAWGGIKLPLWGPRKMAMTGGFLFSLGYLIAAYALSAKSLALLYVGYGIIGGMGLGLSYVTPVATAAKWFPDKKGLITGMVVMGFGFGALMMAKVLAPILMTATGGNLIMVFFAIGITMFVVTLPAGYTMVNPPPSFVPTGYVPPPATSQSGVNQTEITAKQCIFSAKFFMMWTVFFLNIVAGIMFISFQSPLLQDLLKQNLTAAALADPQIMTSLAASGATLIAVSSVFNGLGRFLWGGLSDKIGRIQVFRLILGSQLIVFSCLIFISSPTLFSVFVCYVLLCYGGGFGAMPSFILDIFGAKHMPVVYGSILTAWGCAGIVGPQIVAFLKDNFSTQAAHYTFITACALLSIGLLVTVILNNKPFTIEIPSKLQA